MMSLHDLRQCLDERDIMKSNRHWRYLLNGKEIGFDSCTALLRRFEASAREIKRCLKIDRRANQVAYWVAMPDILVFGVLGEAGSLPAGVNIPNAFWWAALGDLVLSVDLYGLFHIGYARHLKKAVHLYNAGMDRKKTIVG